MYSYLYLLYTISNSSIYCSIFVFTHRLYLHDIHREGRKKHKKKKKIKITIIITNTRRTISAR